MTDPVTTAIDSIQRDKRPGNEWAPEVEGIWHGLPQATYLGSPGLSCSQMKHLYRSPAHFKANLGLKKKTPAMTFGSVVHHITLTPDLPHWWVVKPKGVSFATTEGKAWKLLNATEGKEIITEYGELDEDGTVKSPGWRDAQGIRTAIFNHPKARLAMESGRPEVSCFYRDPETGVFLRCRMDFVHDGNLIVDLKTSLNDVRPRAFGCEVMDRMYHMQAALYLDVYNALRRPDEREKETFVIVAIEKGAPYGCMVYQLSDAAIGKGRDEYRRLLRVYKRCVEANDWPAYSQEIQELELPRWAQDSIVGEW